MRAEENFDESPEKESDESFLRSLKELKHKCQIAALEEGHAKSKLLFEKNLLQRAAHLGYYQSVEWIRKMDPSLNPLDLVDISPDNPLRGANSYECVLLNADLSDEVSCKTLQALFRKPEDLTQKSQSKDLLDWTLIHLAIHRGHLETTRWMLSKIKPKKFKPKQLVEVNSNEDHKKIKQSAWEMFFSGPWANDESCLNFLKLFSEESSQKFQIPSAFSSPIFIGAHPIHLATLYKMPKTLHWLIRREKKLNLANEIVDEKNKVLWGCSATKWIFHGNETNIGLDMSEEERAALWTCLLESETTQKRDILEDFQIALLYLCQTKRNPDFMLSLIPETNRLGGAGWTTILRKTYIELKKLKGPEIQSVLEVIALNYVCLKEKKNNITPETAIHEMESFYLAPSKKAEKPEKLSPLEAKKAANLKALNALVANFQCGNWETNTTSFKLNIPEWIVYGEQSISQSDFKKALVGILKKRAFPIHNSETHEVIVSFGENFNLASTKAELINYFKIPEKPVVKKYKETEWSNLSDTPSKAAPKRVKLSLADKIAQNPSALEEQKEYQKQHVKRCLSSMFVPGQQKPAFMPAAVSKKSPPPTPSISKANSVPTKSNRTRAVSPTPTKNPEPKIPAKSPDFAWERFQALNLEKVLDCCYVMTNAEEDLKGKQEKSLLGKVCNLLVKKNSQIRERFTKGSLSGSLHAHIIFLGQQYTLMKGSAILSRVFEQYAKKNPNANCPVNHLAFREVRNRIRHPIDPINGIAPERLMFLSHDFSEKLTDTLCEFKVRNQFPLKYFDNPIFIDPSRLPPPINIDDTPSFELLIQSLKNNFGLLDILAMIFNELKEKDAKYFEHLSYLHNAAKAVIMLIGQALRDLKAIAWPTYSQLAKVICANESLQAVNELGNQFTRYEYYLNTIAHNFDNENIENHALFQDIAFPDLMSLLHESRNIQENVLSILENPLKINEPNPSRFFARRPLDPSAVAFTPQKMPSPGTPPGSSPEK